LEFAGVQIVTYPHPTLRRKSVTIKRVDAELRKLIHQMFEKMYEHKGVGLAANQVDLPLRVFVMNLAGKQGEGEEVVFINPVVSSPKGTSEAEEGCLSIPGVYGKVIRPERVKIQAYSLRGEEINQEVDGLFARCVQHETDHLDGVLFPDRMNPLARDAIIEDLADFESEFESQRRVGGIPSDAVIAASWTEMEKKYG
jgi:peptide deformylase